MKAIILAGGFGTRLRSVVSDRPKPMALIAGKPFLEHQIKNLKKQGIKDIILAIHYKAEQIKSYFGNGRGIGVNITYSEEHQPLGTAGAIKNASKQIDGPFLVLNGDTLCNVDISKLVDFHRRYGGFASIVSGVVEDVSPFGEVIMDREKIIGYGEKGRFGRGVINQGIYLFEREILDYIPPNKKISLETEVFPELVKYRKVNGYINDGYFMDIGRPETYLQLIKDFVKEMTLKTTDTTKDAMRRIKENGTDIILVSDINGRLQGILNTRIITDYLIDGGNLESPLYYSMKKPREVAYTDDDEKIIEEYFASGTRHLPIVDRDGVIQDVRFFTEKVNENRFPMISGKAPLRISFSGGGTDVPKFFDKYGGVVINSTINKYCHVSVKKRADSLVVVHSDVFDEEIFFNINNLEYNGEMDLLKALIKLTNPDFGLEFYMHNDIQLGRGLGSSATFATLIVKLINQLKGISLTDEEIARIAFRAERDELEIGGGWQDQYASLTGGFNFMEFSKEKNLIYPLRLKKETIDALESRLVLCFVGSSHHSGDVHKSQERTLVENEENITKKMNAMKEIALEIRDSLLIGQLDNIGELLHESWLNKKELSPEISNSGINDLYEFGRENYAIGGKLLGAGGGGYILFYCLPEKKNKLKKALMKSGREVLDFNFELDGARIWIEKDSTNL